MRGVAGEGRTDGGEECLSTSEKRSTRVLGDGMRGFADYQLSPSWSVWFLHACA
jgi:hypothetical protein